MAIIRSASQADVPAMLEIYAPFVHNTAVTFEEVVPTETEWWERVQKIQRENPWLVCVIDGCVAGYAYAGAHRVRASYRWNREVSVYVHPAFYKRGVARGLYTALFELLKLQGVQNLLGGLTEPNPGSAALHERLGFTKAATYNNIGYKFGKWHSVSWYELFIGSPMEPQAVKAFPSIAAQDQVAAALAAGASLVR